MFSRVVAACRKSGWIVDLLAVVGDEEAAALAGEQGVSWLREPRPGLASALEAADAATAQSPATLVIAADLPLATAAAIDAVCSAGSDGPCVVVAPTRDGGTGALLRRPADVIATVYGADSAAAHLELAAAAGVASVRTVIPALGFDVDTPDQLDEISRIDDHARRWSVR